MKGIKLWKNTKRMVERKHFLNRCNERLGHELSQKDLVRKVQNGELEYYYSPSLSRSCWIYTEDNKDYVVVYDSTRKTMVTIYPKTKGELKDEFEELEV